MINIIHISDLHFGREIPKVIGALKDSVHDIQPDQIIISGDITQRAKHSEFRSAASFLEALNTPYFVIPGNHDLTSYRLLERFLYPWKKWKRYIEPTLEPLNATEHKLVMGINTARRMGFYWDWSRGRINTHQVNKLLKHLSTANEDQLRILVAHHPFWLPAVYEHRCLIGGRDYALAKLSAQGLDIIMSGHVHMAYAEVVRGVIISHAGTTLSDRLIPDHPNNFNRITGNRSHLIIELFAWNGEHFASHSQQHFMKTDHGWTHERVVQ